jgi:tetratricopeptide (TPR) repeat protein
MKKALLLFFIVFIAFGSTAQNANDNDIKKAIQAEFDAFFANNMEAEKAAWQHSPDVSISFFSRDAHNTTKGWDSISAMIERSSKQNLPRNDSLRMKVANWNIRSNGNMALVEYDEIFPSATQTTPWTNHNYRMMVKENDKWTTASLIRTAPDTYKNTDQSLENDLNRSGYELLDKKKINDALEVFKLNVKLFPNSWNTYDSLGEAYALAGDKKQAVENYEKSIKLNPKSQSGPPALAKLKQK